jgi:hypothetical protein
MCEGGRVEDSKRAAKLACATAACDLRGQCEEE